ncbi:hypothetical protein E4U61_007144 [Claviceps capensis]|nr:hypothetical protein E4U61_007144 [Claviceps capensis]
MGPGLLTQSKDPNVTYEVFCRYIADAAYTQERAHRERSEEKKKKAALLNDRPARRKSYGRQPTIKKEARVEETAGPVTGNLIELGLKKERYALVFLCKKEGHIARDRLDRRDIARVCKELSDEEEQDRHDQEVADSSSDSSSDSVSDSGKDLDRRKSPRRSTSLRKPRLAS